MRLIPYVVKGKVHLYSIAFTHMLSSVALFVAHKASIWCVPQQHKSALMGFISQQTILPVKVRGCAIGLQPMGCTPALSVKLLLLVVQYFDKL